MVKFEGYTSALNPKQLEFFGNVVEKEGFEEANVRIEAVGQTGDNYVASVVRIIAEKDGKTFRMIAKIAPTDQRSVLGLDTHILFYNEYLMYSQVLPKFTAMEEAAGIPASERLRYAKFYGALLEEPLEIILLEDLQVPGFALLSRFESLPNEAIKLVLKSLAKIHSCSFALKNQEPDTFNEFRESLGDLWLQVIQNENALLFFKAVDKDAMSVLSSDKHKAVLRKYGGKKGELTRDLHNTNFESRYSVILQGDSWANNILFRLEGTTPAECCMIDYQLSGVSSPAADLLYMISSCSDYEGRAKHFHEWMDYYHSELDKHLNKFGLKSENWYPRERLDADLKRHGPLGLLTAIMFASGQTRESAEATKLLEAIIRFNDDYEIFEKALNECRLTAASDKIKTNFKIKVTEAIDSYLELGLVQID